MSESNNTVFPKGMTGPFVYIKKKRGAGFWVATGIASFFFLCSLFLFMLLIGSLLLSKSIITGGAVDDEYVSEEIIEGNGENKIAVIAVKGILTNEASEHLFFQKPGIVEIVKEQLEHAAKDDHVKAVLLEIDSPGGGITASDIIYHEIIKFKKNTQKKVVVYMEDIAASGGYYIASAADFILAHPTTITGSIGVIMPLINVSEFINRHGVVDNSIASGDMKEIGSPLKQMTSEEAEVLQNIINEMYMQFVEVVSSGRNLDIEEVKKIADGRIYTGKQAVEAGLVDKLGYLEDAIIMAKKSAGIDEATVVRYKRLYGFAELFGMLCLKLSQKNTITLDISQIPDQGVAKPMYLWNGQSTSN
ncbi:MAG: signal peptide peptidase SppA [Candidatus Kuenenia sp.]|nr:signal peptide peptidase SppA [Candidatus Kuenenia hertensis]